jgi:hypothetical protein
MGCIAGAFLGKVLFLTPPGQFYTAWRRDHGIFILVVSQPGANVVLKYPGVTSIIFCLFESWQNFFSDRRTADLPY